MQFQTIPALERKTSEEESINAEDENEIAASKEEGNGKENEASSPLPFQDNKTSEAAKVSEANNNNNNNTEDDGEKRDEDGEDKDQRSGRISLKDDLALKTASNDSNIKRGQ